MCVIEDRAADIVVASYHSVSRNSVRFKAVGSTLNCRETQKTSIMQAPGNKRWRKIFKNMRNKVCSVSSMNTQP